MKQWTFSLVLGILLLFGAGSSLFAQHGEHEAHDQSGQEVKHEEKEGEFDVAEVALEHIANSNAIHIFGNTYIHLPAILYAPEHGWSFFLTSKFDAHHHGNGTKAIDHYVLKHGSILRIADPDFPYGEVPVEGFHTKKETVDGKEKDVHYAVVNGKEYRLDKKTTLDGGLFGGGITSFYDFSISKAVVTMLMVLLLMFWLFRSAAKIATSSVQAPKGALSLVEPVVEFIRDEVAIPFIGEKRYEEFMPFLLSLFFFILGLNLIGQIPFMGNVTGNLSFTFVLAILTILYVNIKGNAHYWKHIFWMPNVPSVIKIFVLTPVEILSSFVIKPVTLMLRLFANITAGHIVILAFVGLIFIFGHSGQSVGGASVGALAGFLLSMFMMSLEILVAFIQAFVFTILAASYFGAAVEEAHH